MFWFVLFLFVDGVSFAAGKIWIDQSGFSGLEKLYYLTSMCVNRNGIEVSRAVFLTGDGIEKTFMILKPYQIVKNEKYEVFLCLQTFNLAPRIRRQRPAARLRLVECRQVR